MIKRLKPVFWLSGIAAALIISFFLLRDVFHILPAADDTDSDKTVTIYDFVGSTADSLSISNAQDNYVIKKKVEKTFVIEGKEDYPIDNSMIINLLNDFGKLVAQSKVDTNVTDFEQYGLTEPLATIVMVKGDNSYKVEIGDPVSTSENFYMRVDGTDTVYTVESYLASQFLYSKFKFYDSTFIPYDGQVDPENITEFKIGGKNHKYTILALKNILEEDELDTAFRMVEPMEHQFSIEKSNNIFTLFETLVAAEVVSDDVSVESLKSFGLYEPLYTLYYKNKDNEKNVYFGNSTDQDITYMMQKDGNLIHAIATSEIAVLKGEITDYCEKNAYTRSYDTIDNLVITGLNKNYRIQITGTSDDEDLAAYINDKYVPYDNFADLYGHIITIAIRETAEKPKNAPVLVTITINLKNGEKDILKFYKISDLRCFFELNGKGVFSVATSSVEEIITNAQKLYDGKEIILEW